MKEENKYPCTDCEEEKDCEQQEKYVSCYAWRKWFHEQWQKIRKLFGRNVSNRHDAKDGDDNEGV